MTPNSSLVACAAMLAVLGGTAGAAEKAEKKPEALEMTLSASVLPAKSYVTVRARIQPDARSRELTIEWVGDDLSGGSHLVSLDGARAPTAHRYTLKHLSPGQYVVTAVLRLNDGTIVRRRANLSVLGVGETGPFGAGETQGLAGRSRPAWER